jgi:hypothetical protein
VGVDRGEEKGEVEVEVGGGFQWRKEGNIRIAAAAASPARFGWSVVFLRYKVIRVGGLQLAFDGTACSYVGFRPIIPSSLCFAVASELEHLHPSHQRVPQNVFFSFGWTKTAQSCLRILIFHPD